MSNFLAKIALQNKLNKINKIIDKKIINGKSYKKESRLHRAIRQQLNLLVNFRSI